jgi:hypothetical protein
MLIQNLKQRDQDKNTKLKMKNTKSLSLYICIKSEEGIDSNFTLFLQLFPNLFKLHYTLVGNAMHLNIKGSKGNWFRFKNFIVFLFSFNTIVTSIFQYLLHQFASCFFSIEFEFHCWCVWIKFKNLNSIQLACNKNVCKIPYKGD